MANAAHDCLRRRILGQPAQRARQPHEAGELLLVELAGAARVDLQEAVVQVVRHEA